MFAYHVEEVDWGWEVVLSCLGYDVAQWTISNLARKPSDDEVREFLAEKIAEVFAGSVGDHRAVNAITVEPLRRRPSVVEAEVQGGVL